MTAALPNPKAIEQAEARARAWSRILEAVLEQREALDHRIHLAKPDDTYLEADVQTWSELSRGLTDFLKARRSA
jgi:hypothetical protein